jgi:citrate lyase beta subunit
MLARAPSSGADGLVLDLEASVPAGEKARARTLVADAVPRIAAMTPAAVFVRVNPLASGLTADEIAAVAGPGLAGVVLPATEAIEEVRQVARWLAAAEMAVGLAPGTLRLLPLLETARGVLRAYDLLTADTRVVAALFGAEDFRQDMGAPRSHDGQEVRYARAAIGLAARAARVAALDMVFIDLDNESGLAEETRGGRLLGYTGKQVIHPRQIPVVHRALAPSDSELDWARRVIAEAARAADQGIGAFVLDGRMIDLPVVIQAEQVVAWANADDQASICFWCSRV